MTGDAWRGREGESFHPGDLHLSSEKGRMPNLAVDVGNVSRLQPSLLQSWAPRMQPYNVYGMKASRIFREAAHELMRASVGKRKDVNL